MDIFDVLAAIAKRKIAYMHSGIKGYEALKKAELDVSREYHISLPDIKRLVGETPANNEVHRQRRPFT